MAKRTKPDPLDALTASERAVLEAVARAEFRDPLQQLQYMLHQEAQRLGIKEQAQELATLEAKVAETKEALRSLRSEQSKLIRKRTRLLKQTERLQWARDNIELIEGAPVAVHDAVKEAMNKLSLAVNFIQPNKVISWYNTNITPAEDGSPLIYSMGERVSIGIFQGGAFCALDGSIETEPIDGWVTAAQMMQDFKMWFDAVTKMHGMIAQVEPHETKARELADQIIAAAMAGHDNENS